MIITKSNWPYSFIKYKDGTQKRSNIKGKDKKYVEFYDKNRKLIRWAYE